MMTMNNMYIISSWREHLKEADDGMVDGVGLLGGRWGVTLFFSLLFNFLVQAASGVMGDFPYLSRGMKTQ